MWNFSKFLFLFFLSSSLLAMPPVVNYNVQVMDNATPAQCNNWEGQEGPEDNPVAANTEMGQTNFGGPGVRSCSNCSVNRSGACICKTCYDYSDGP